MRLKGFIGGSYLLTSIPFECQRCINMFAEPDELGTGKDGEVAALIGTPGLSPLVQPAVATVRGSYYTTTGVLYVVVGNTVYSVSSSWVATSVGTLQTSTGPVEMYDNGSAGSQLVIVDGTNGYYLTLPGGTVTQFVSANWLGSYRVRFMDGYFIFVQPGTPKFYLSDLDAVTFTAPALTSRNGGPDNIISYEVSNRNLWLFGDRTTEVWFDSGSVNNPFQYTPGSLSQVGCVGAYASTKFAGTVAWVGKNEDGQVQVYMANGYSPVPISTGAVEIALNGYSSLSDTIAWSYMENGHEFLVLTFPTGNATWVYDQKSGLWHERLYNNNGIFARHRANCHAFAYGVHVVGDYANGWLYQQSLTTYTDNGTAIIRQRTAPHVSVGNKRIFYDELQIDFEAATGLDGTGQGTDPQAMLTWSDDGGRTWSNEKWASIGKIGTYKNRTIWRRLGQGRNRVFSVRVSDPVKVVMMGAEVQMEVGRT